MAWLRPLSCFVLAATLATSVLANKKACSFALSAQAGRSDYSPLPLSDKATAVFEEIDFFIDDQMAEYHKVSLPLASDKNPEAKKLRARMKAEGMTPENYLLWRHRVDPSIRAALDPVYLPKSQTPSPLLIKTFVRQATKSSAELGSSPMAAVHGTSLEGIQHLLKTGTLQPTLSDEGSFFVFPNGSAKNLPMADSHRWLTDRNEIFAGAENYANTHSVADAFLAELGLTKPQIIELEKADGSEVSYTPVWPFREKNLVELQSFYKKKFNIPKEKVRAAAEKSAGRKGYVIVLKPAALQKNALREGHLQDDLQILTGPNGLTYDNIEAIVPLSEADLQALVELTK